MCTHPYRQGKYFRLCRVGVPARPARVGYSTRRLLVVALVQPNNSASNGRFYTHRSRLRLPPAPFMPAPEPEASALKQPSPESAPEPTSAPGLSSEGRVFDGAAPALQLVGEVTEEL